MIKIVITKNAGQNVATYFKDTLGGHYGVFQDNSCVSLGTGSSGMSVKIILVYLRRQAVRGCPLRYMSSILKDRPY